MQLRYEYTNTYTDCEQCGGSTEEYHRVLVYGKEIWYMNRTGCFGSIDESEMPLVDAIIAYMNEKYPYLGALNIISEEISKHTWHNTGAMLICLKSLFLENFDFEIDIHLDLVRG